jgi:competence protein ComEA
MDIKNISKKQRILIALGVILILLIGLYFANGQGHNLDFSSSEKSSSIQKANEDMVNEDFRYVEITGQVLSPGVYEISRSLMVIELIELAGGLTEFADLETVHKDISLSGIVEDRQKIYIPALPDYKNGSKDIVGPMGSDNSSKININTATLEQLDALPDIGPSTANKIISARPYKTIEDLKNVEGIGEKTYNNLISVITL